MKRATDFSIALKKVIKLRPLLLRPASWMRRRPIRIITPNPLTARSSVDLRADDRVLIIIVAAVVVAGLASLALTLALSLPTV